MFNNICYAKGYTYIGSQDEKLVELFFKADDNFNAKKFDKAAELLEEAYKINPEQMQIIGFLCSCYNEIEDAIELEKKAKEGLYIAQKKKDKDNIGRFYHYLAGSYQLRKEYDLAIKYYKLTLINKPYFTSDYPPLAYCYYQLEKYDEAIEYYKKAGNENMVSEVQEARRKKYPAEQHLFNAIGYGLNKDDISAEKEYRRALDIDSNNIIALVQIASYDTDKKEYREAISKGEKALALLDKPENKQHDYLYKLLYANVLSKSYEQVGDFNKSTNYFKLYLIATSTADAYKSIESNNYEQALEYFKEALKIDIETEYAPYNYMAIDGIIDLLFILGKYEEVKEYIQKGIKICKSENNKEKLAEFSYKAGKYYDRTKQYEKALKYYDIACEKTQNKDLKCLCIGQSHAIWLAKKIYDKALEKLYECKKIIENGAVDYCDVESQIICLKSLMDENSDVNKHRKYFALGKELFYKEQYKEAVDEFAQALKYIPQDIETLFLLGESLYSLKKYEEASEVAGEGFVICQRNHDYSLLEGFAYQLATYYYDIKKDYKLAQSYITYAIKQNPDVDYFCLFAHCYSKLGEYDKANEWYEKCKKLDPKNELKYLSFQVLCIQEKEKKLNNE